MKERRTTQREDESQIAVRTIEAVIGEPLVPTRKNPHAVALSKLGASKGGKARAAKLGEAKRRAIAKKAAAARWRKAKPKSESDS
jgi:hypothetical protein